MNSYKTNGLKRFTEKFENQEKYILYDFEKWILIWWAIKEIKEPAGAHCSCTMPTQSNR